MRKRLIISSVLIMMLIISIVIISFIGQPRVQIIYGVISLVIVILTFIYLFSGVAKLFTMSIYIALITLGLIYLDQYQHAVIAVGTLSILLNPLADLENYLEKKLKEEAVLPLSISLRGKYWPFFSYRQEMKNYIKLPKMKKMLNKAWYLRLRQLTTIVLFFAAIYLFINELKNLYFDLTDYNWYNMMIFYAVIVLFVLAFILVKSGFTALLRVSVMFTFIPTIFLVNLTTIGTFSKYVFSIIIFILGLAYVIFEKINSLKNVAYNAYEYYDPADKRFVYANEFYEPYVYNESYTLVGIYKFKSDLKKFEKQLNDVLFYANRKHFMITAYTFNGKQIEIYTEFYKKDYHKAEKFKHFLQYEFETEVHANIYNDKYKETYETTFFHKTEYIVARALKLSDLLEDLNIGQKQLIISVIFTFNSLSDIEALSKQYFVARMEGFDTDAYYAARVSVKTLNSKFVMEQKIRDVLLSAMIYRANYVRILVYYEGELIND